MGRTLRTFPGKRRARGQVPGPVHPPGGHYQPAHPGHCRWKGNLPGQRLPRQGHQKARYPRWGGVPATLCHAYSSHPPVIRSLNLQLVPEEKPDIDTLIQRTRPMETGMERFSG